MALELNKVTWYSQSIAIVLFVGVFAVGYWIGSWDTDAVERIDAVPAAAPTLVADVSYACSDEKGIIAVYGEGEVRTHLSDGREIVLLQTVAASGARYANEDESVVFWTEGENAFVEENGEQTYSNCIESPLPV